MSLSDIALTPAQRARLLAAGTISIPERAPPAPRVSHAETREKHLKVARAWLALGKPYGGMKRLAAEAGLQWQNVKRHMNNAQLTS